MDLCKLTGMKHFYRFILALVLPVGLSLQPLCRAEDLLFVPKGTLLKLQLNKNLSTTENQEGDPFTAYVIESVYQGDQVVIPKGSTVSGSISRITRPGRFKGKAVMRLLFESIQIRDREELPILASLVRIDPDENVDIGAEGGLEGPGIGAGSGGGAGVGAGMSNTFWTRGKDLELHLGSTMEISLDQVLKIPVKGSQ